MNWILAGLVLLAAIGLIVVRWRTPAPPPDHHGSDPVIKLVNEVLADAVRSDATEIRVALTGTEGGAEVRYTVDGETRPATRTPAPLAAHVMRRLKILAGLDPLPTRGAEEGRFTLRFGDRKVTFTAEFREADPVDEVTLAIAYGDDLLPE